MPISEAEINHALETWGNALVTLSKSFEDDGIEAARNIASDFIDAAYGYGLGPVLFKPTMANGDQTFRTTAAGALAYFVGHDSDYPRDGGFGIKGWRAVEFDKAASFTDGEVALWMGNVSFTDKAGNVTVVDKSFGYKKDENGTLRIVQHHSSLPYAP